MDTTTSLFSTLAETPIANPAINTTNTSITNQGDLMDTSPKSLFATADNANSGGFFSSGTSNTFGGFPSQGDNFKGFGSFGGFQF